MVLAVDADDLFAFRENCVFWSQVRISTFRSSYFGSSCCFEDQLGDTPAIVCSLDSLDLRDILDVQGFKLGQRSRCRRCKQGGRLTIREIHLDLRNQTIVVYPIVE